MSTKKKIEIGSNYGKWVKKRKKNKYSKNTKAGRWVAEKKKNEKLHKGFYHH